MINHTNKHFLFVFVILILTSCQITKTSNHHIEYIPLKENIDTMVILPPSWAFGIMYGSYENQEQSINLVKEIIEHDYPIDAFWTDSWIWDWENKGVGPAKYLDFVADTVSYPDKKYFWTNFLQSNNIKAGMWVWDCIQQTGNEIVYEDFLQKGYFKNTYINTDSWHNGSKTTIIGDKDQIMKGTWTGNIDFENENAVSYFKTKMKPFFDDGLDFIKLDRTDAIPVCKAMYEMTQELSLESEGRGFILSHSHGVDSDEFKKYPGKWTDDTRSTWSANDSNLNFSPWLPAVGLKENIAMYTNLNRHFYKIPFLSNDMGGFALSTNQFVDEELYIRWLQFAMFVPLTTPFSQPENPTGNIAFKISPKADQVFKFYSHLKMQLFPYIYSYAHRSRWEGINIIRPIEGQLYQYLFGNEVLVAPIYVPQEKSRVVFLPDNTIWYDFYTLKKYNSGMVNIPIVLEKIPIFIRQGSIIPMRKYESSIEKGTNNTIDIQVFAGDKSQFILFEDDGKSNDYLQDGYSKTYITQQTNDKVLILNIYPIEGNYKGKIESRNWNIYINGISNIKKIEVNGENIKFTKNESQILISLNEIPTHTKLEMVCSM